MAGNRQSDPHCPAQSLPGPKKQPTTVSQANPSARGPACRSRPSNRPQKAVRSDDGMPAGGRFRHSDDKTTGLANLCDPGQGRCSRHTRWYWSRLKSRDHSHSCARRNPDKEALMLDSSVRWNDKAFKRYQYPPDWQQQTARRLKQPPDEPISAEKDAIWPSL